MSVCGKAFRENEERFQSLVKFSSDIILILRFDGTIHYISPSVHRILGYKQEDLYGKSVFKYIYIKDQKKAQQRLAESFQNSGKPIYVELKIKHSKGNWVDFEVIANNLVDDPSIKGIVINARDITERKKAETEILTSEAKYRSLVEDAGAGIVSVDTEGNLTYVNRALCKIIGYTEAELVGKNFAEFLHEDDLDAILKLFETAMKRSKEKPELEFRAIHKDGHIVYLYGRSTITFYNQEIVGFNAVVTDITKRRMAEEAQRESEDKYKNLFNLSPASITILDANGVIIDCNEMTEKITGYSKKEIVGKQFQELLTLNKHHLPKLLKIYEKLLAGEPIEPYELEIIRKDGKSRWISVLNSIEKSNGKIATIQVISRDITEQKLAEQALVKSESRYRTISELISDFVYSIQIEPDGTQITEWSTDTLHKVLGVSHGELVKKGGWKKFIYPEDLPILMRRHKALASGKPDVAEYRVITKTGEIHWIRDYGQPVWDKNENRVVRIYGAAQEITDSKVAEDKVRQSELRFRQFFENDPDYCYMISADGWILDVNNAALKGLGYKKGELVGKPINVIYAPESMERANNLFKKWKKKKELKDEELVVLTKTSSRRTVLLSASMVKDNEGKTLHSISVQRDITEHKKAEEALRESEEKFRTLAENSPNMIFINQFGKIVYVNRKCVDVMGYQEKEFYDDRFDFMKLIASESKEAILKAFKNHKEAKEVPTFEYSILTKDGKKIEAFYSSKLIKYHGSPAILGTILDISDRKTAEKALKESEVKYRTLVDNVSDVIIEIDTEGNFSYVSPNVTSLTGFTPEEVIGKSALHYIHPEDLELAVDMFEEVYNTHQSYNMEFRTSHKNGHYIWVEGRGNFIKKDGEIKIIGSLRDITDRKHAEEAIRESEAQLRRILNSMNDAIHVIDRQFKIVMTNDAFVDWAAKLGLETDMIGKEFFTAFPFLLKHVKKGYQEVFNSGKTIIKEGYTTIFGKRFYLETIRIPILEKGQVNQIVTIVRDKTQQKSSEVEIAESQERYKVLVNTIPQGIVVIQDGKIVFANEASASMLKLKGQDDLTKLKPEKIIAPKYRKQLMNLLKRRLTGEKDIPSHYEAELLRSNGEVFPVEIHGQLMNYKGRPAAQYVVTDITERKRIEEVILESEKKYRELVERSSQGMVIAQGVPPRIVFANKAIAEILGYTNSELLNLSGSGLIGRVHPDDIPLFKKKCSTKPKKVNEKLNTELRIYSKDGTMKWLQINCELVEFNGEPAVQASFNDITERKLAEDALRLSEERNRILFETASDPIFIADVKTGMLIDANQKAQVLIGRSISEIRKMHQSELHDPGEVEKYREIFKKHVSQGKGINEDLYLVNKEGKKIPVEISANVVELGNKRVIQGIFRDMTERKKLEDQLRKKLRESEHLYWLSEGLKYSDTIEDVCLKGLNSVCLGFNFQRGLIFTLKETGKYLELKHVRGFRTKNKKLTIRLTRKNDIFTRVIKENNWFIIQNGKVLEGKGKYSIPSSLKKTFGFPNKKDSYIAAPINSKQKVIGFVIVDSTAYDPRMQESNEMLGMYLTTIGIALENVKLYRELEESFTKLKEIDRMKTEFIDIASHELRTPLASIKIYTDLMREGYIGKFSKNEKKQLEDMNKNIINLNNLITDMLDFTRTDKDFFRLSLKDVSLSKLAADIVDRFKNIAETKKIGLKVRSIGDTRVKSDSEMLKKLFTNLLSNALKYSTRGGQIKIEVQGKAKGTQVSVVDNGLGIAKKDLPHIFERFYMGDTSLTREKDQLGLGLSIAKSIVERHGGRIWAESKLGKGSTFNFMIPKAPNKNKKEKINI